MNQTKPIRILVVDDTIVYRKIVSDVLTELPGVEVVGTANNGKIALTKISALEPDLITLDIEMPEMNGIEVLEHIRRENLPVGVIVLSTLTYEGGDLTIHALELGAFDFIPKPQSGTMTENRESIKNFLAPMLKAFQRRREIKNILLGGTPAAKPKEMKKGLKKTATTEITDDVIQRMHRLSGRIKPKSEIIVIGISTGGPNALSLMMPQIPSNIGVPILIVQHMPPIFTQSLANSLGAKCGIPVQEARDGEIVIPNKVLIAPGGKQMKVAASPDGKNRIIRITDDPPENSCKPSVDYLFRSIADHYVGRATGVIMTGMGSDGRDGARRMKQKGAFIIAQDESTCTVFGMPKEIIEIGIADAVVPLDQIAQEIVQTVKGYY
ncbi:MAG: protein-glutamate methylesterase/protein-glutamine glutaminase [Thermodesulfobacteriota bacterium]